MRFSKALFYGSVIDKKFPRKNFNYTENSDSFQPGVLFSQGTAGEPIKQFDDEMCLQANKQLNKYAK